MSTPEMSPSERAMEAYLSNNKGFQEVRPAVDLGLPTLPDLKKLAQELAENGKMIIDQSAGDIADTNQPLSDELAKWMGDIRKGALKDVFPWIDTSLFGHHDKYQQQFSAVTDILAKSWGITDTPVKSIQTVSGRMALDFFFSAMKKRAVESAPGKAHGLILDPMAWSGYKPYCKPSEHGLKIVNAPVQPGSGLQMTASGLEQSLEYLEKQGQYPSAVVTIVPSNPTGVGMDRNELKKMIEMAASKDLPVLIDAFYSPLAPEGHAESVPMGWLEKELSPEAFAYVGMLVGETKVISSQKKTGTLMWMAPSGQDEMAKEVMMESYAKLKLRNAYPRPDEALAAAALHTFKQENDEQPGLHLHEAMGPRYLALETARQAIRKMCDDLGLPCSVGGSFYAVIGLVDADGQPLIKDTDGGPVIDPAQVSQRLVKDHGVVGAPGAMFRSGAEAGPLIRVSAAATLEDINKLGEIFKKLLSA
ncbi:MAG: aminotransferase class I/II-fold pyridoxal phosphate-dependent enzyme [Candidatus Gracilibacteria bacterium]|nr:aminotransferase class I/II-fold pyridoxal phosphate-dependent enzyme [Candidatus Gracilibacteria bacterium]